MDQLDHAVPILDRAIRQEEVDDDGGIGIRDVKLAFDSAHRARAGALSGGQLVLETTSVFHHVAELVGLEPRDV